MSEDLKNRIKKYYEAQVWMRKCGMNNVLARIQNMKNEIDSMGERNIFYNIESRIKTFESAFEKISRKGLDMSEKGIDDMHDIAGIRIIVSYLDDIYTVRDLIKRPALLLQNEAILKVVKERDYVKEPKKNGYRAYHLIVKVKVTWQKKSIQVPVEIQIMTRAQKLWADYEHDLKYKNEFELAPNTEAEFEEASKHNNNFDVVVQEMYKHRQKQLKAKSSENMDVEEDEDMPEETAEEIAELAEKIITIADVKAASAANS